MKKIKEFMYVFFFCVPFAIIIYTGCVIGILIFNLIKFMETKKINDIEVKDFVDLSPSKETMRAIEIAQAKELLRSEGYFVDNLWQTEDVKINYKCTEEPKQKTLTRDYFNRNCKTCNLGQEGHCELKLESKCASYANDETLGDYWISCLDDESDSVLYKQETLNEVAERLYPYEVGHDVFDRNCEIDFERERFIEGAKWQAERMYSLMDQYVDDVMGGCNLIAKEWFEQFKKKVNGTN